MLFAHGYVAPSYPDGAFPFDVSIGIDPGPDVPPDVVALRDLMLCQGYALAAPATGPTVTPSRTACATRTC